MQIWAQITQIPLWCLNLVGHNINPGNLSSFFLRSPPPPFLDSMSRDIVSHRKKKKTWTLLWTEFYSPSSVQFSSVTQSCLTLCDPMNRSMPGLPVHHQLPESTQTQVHRVSDAFQPSHPLSSPSPPALNLSQHQGLFQWVSSSPHYPPNIYNL